MKKSNIIELEDLEQKSLSCTLWDEYADEIHTYISKPKDTPTILIIQFGKIKTWEGAMILSSSLFATKLLFNANIDEVKAFNESVCEGGRATSERLTQTFSQAPYTIEDEFLQSTDRKRIDEIRETQEVRNCVALTTIICIESSYGWWYNACKKDFKKVQEIKVVV
ncbi:uncharacterized protein [Spinacia oleracea]|uniref:Replication protein A OB domain-containing protein n=1 Tax=Spinacia oleracea TaxID=3562 RepID=A0A9R0ILK2_SPIOL|nr:uncharacterized protein LOC110790694 [Spinacia oleracea]